MFIVHNIFYFFFFIVIGVIYFASLGWLLVVLLLKKHILFIDLERDLFSQFALSLLCGILINFSSILIFQSFKISIVISSSLAFLGLILFLKNNLISNINIKICVNRTVKLLGVLCISFLIISPIIIEPLKEWDVRTYWFFHAKMMYYAGSLGLSAGWLHPSVGSTHIDYPNIIPSLAAQINYYFGFWNEYLPKMSIYYFYFPILFWLFSFAKKNFGFIFLLLIFPFGFYPHIWDGMMDGILAIYFCISILLFFRYLANERYIDLVSSIICLLLLPNIKNEGYLLLITGLAGFSTSLLINKKYKKLFFRNYGWLEIVPLIMVFSPTLLWVVYKQVWNISNDLQIGTLTSIQRIIIRLIDGSLLNILSSSYTQLSFLLIFASLSIAILFLVRRSFSISIYPIIVMIIIYFIGLTTIYLLTPLDLTWHLEYSIDRTLLPIRGCLLLIVYFVIDNLGKTEKQFQQEIVN